MATRRELLLAATGGCLIGRVWASDGAGTVAQVEALAALPGKKPLIRRSFRPPNFETPLADLAAPLTDNGAFFVRYHLTVIPRIDPDSWRLQVSGASARRALTLSLAELRSGFEQVEVVAVNQCAGNRRGLFTPRVPGVQWGGGAMGNARWRGVRLREVLQRAGVAADALEVVFGGADAPVLPATPAFVKSLPVERALDESTLVAFEMNGRPLPHWNGAPARLVVPGWVGTYWMKHLASIRIEPRAFDGFWMKTAYRVPTGAFPGARFTSQETAETTPVTELLVNSLIVSPGSGARLSRGAHAELAGKAWDGGAGIEGVEVSVDGGQRWRDATLQRDLGRFAWREFRFVLDTSRAGRLDVAVRARSRNGAKQPDKLTPNPSGYHDNIVQAVSLEIA
ncbi:MAG: oxidase [Gammaproteobacteria bacterium 13_2_20CM_66_19]|nr:MAG: oxidase [Gammaproteobacteria bacterium 13_2_20CM_66_19]TLZ02772.1 MAG: oxidase [Gammaproteobacteria bacterium]TLZ08954.1 MAG: oxidase [Gammaproteobacteria bacterium]TLZ12676.1 MAG: oxidase [Gammaproteobacteria bacterium]TLZ21745.1 MAG: oxidase [Gammaproteobacteria bacterium]